MERYECGHKRKLVTALVLFGAFIILIISVLMALLLMHMDEYGMEKKQIPWIRYKYKHPYEGFPHESTTEHDGPDKVEEPIPEVPAPKEVEEVEANREDPDTDPDKLIKRRKMVRAPRPPEVAPFLFKDGEDAEYEEYSLKHSEDTVQPDSNSQTPEEFASRNVSSERRDSNSVIHIDEENPSGEVLETPDPDVLVAQGTGYTQVEGAKPRGTEEDTNPK